MRLALPATAERLVMRLGQVVYMSFIVSISSLAFASHNIAGTIKSFIYMPAYGLTTAATVLIGFARGKRDYTRARQVGYWSSLYGVICLSILGIALYLGGGYFATFFTEDVKAIAQIDLALKIDAFIQPALAVSSILAGALQGLGDTKSPLYSTMIGMWGVRVIGVYLLGVYFRLGLMGIWIAILIDLYLRSILLSWRFDRVLKLLKLNQ